MPPLKNMKKILKNIKKIFSLDSWLVNILAAGALTFILVTFVFVPVVVNGESMYPTLNDHQIGLMAKWYKEENIKRFDIVAVKADGKNIIKRVIGLPGETVEYRENTLYINDKKVEESFLKEDEITGNFYMEAQDGFVLLGDNRQHSTDSRYYGVFDYSEFMGAGFFSLTYEFGIIN